MLVICLITVGCQKRSDQDRIEPGEKTPVPGGTLVVGLIGEPDALNPLTALSKPGRNIISLLFRRLADINEDLASFSPQLARNWEFSLDSSAITFHLRTDVYWHDGARFTARDVVFTYHRQVDPKVVWDGVPFKGNIKGVEATNDSTAVFLFKKKTPTMLMDAVEGYIVPAHLLQDIPPHEIRQSPFNRSPVGTGPFRFVSWKSQQSIVLEKSGAYYREGRPYLDRIIFRIEPDRINLLNQLVSGDIDFMEGVPPRDFSRLAKEWEAKTTDIRPVSFLGKQYEFIGWNLIDPDNYSSVMAQAGDEQVQMDRLLLPNKLFSSQKVRAALTMAMDRDALTQVINQGTARRMDGPVPIIWSSYDPEANTVWPYDPELALKYLNEEGWRDTDGDGILDKDGEPFRFEMATNIGNERREQALTIIQEQLKKIGVEMIPRIVDPGLLFGRMLIPRQFDAALIGWDVALKMDLTPLFHSLSLLMPFNFVSYRSEQFDRWQEAANESLNPAATREYWDKIAHLLSGELPYTWLYYKMETVGLHSRFHGAIFDRRGAYVNLEDWWIPAEERTETDRKADS